MTTPPDAGRGRAGRRWAVSGALLAGALGAALLAGVMDVAMHQAYMLGAVIAVGLVAALAISRLMQESQRRHESEQLLLGVFQTSPDAVAVSSLDDGRLVMINEQFSRSFGVAAEAAIGRDAVSLGLWADPAERAALRERVLREGQVHNQPVRLRAGDGRELMALISASRLQLKGQDHLVTVSRDVSALERERADTGKLLQHAAVGLALVRNNVFMYVNPMYETLLGFPAGTLAGHSTRVAFPSDRAYERFRERAASRAIDGDIDLETKVIRHDGSSFPGRMRGRAVDPHQPYAAGMIWVLEDIGEHQHAQRQLAEAKEQAEAANRAKSSFLAAMSHEMRTPLNGVLGMIRLALGEPPHSAQRDSYLRHAEASGQSLAEIISDVLDLSRIEAGRLQLESVVFDLHALAESQQALHAPQASARGLRLSLSIAPGVPRTVRGDPARVRQLIVNFLGNALKFTEAGHIELLLEAPTATGAAAGVRITVRDTGIGIAPELQQRLFQPFVQADSSTTRRFGGTGLGLSICRELAQLMGGRVGLHSRPGQGSSFWAELPLAAASAPADAPVVEPGLPQPLAGLRVLVAEDHPVNMMIAAAMLRRWGAVVDEAQDGAAALEQVQQAEAEGRHYGAVLMDMHMPRLSGIDATQRLRERFDAQQLPIIALTAAALASEQRQAMEAGMNDFVSKPIDAAQLLQALLRAAAPAGPPPPAGTQPITPG
ncbi:hybrid sensor histidine kinase/response regulator [Aquabacterium sp.]|uniref:hybrid sensor histidine kinase/response regulator n=1 Tax=Aquabacterium sp. TaxID=1872578 RepID=UPI002CEB8965|nr:ATP-binding protein [Aquabacterium sp.]HSW04693.1 ATP-binding protein [Aquabacterium sp.]